MNTNQTPPPEVLGSPSGSPSSEIPPLPEGWIYAGHGPIKHRPNGEDHCFNIALLYPEGWDTVFAHIGHGDNHYAVRVGSEIASQNGMVPLCAHCRQPATCHGQYEDQPEGYACSDCCGHWCEDGRCHPLENVKCPPTGATEKEVES